MKNPQSKPVQVEKKRRRTIKAAPRPIGSRNPPSGAPLEIITAAPGAIMTRSAAGEGELASSPAGFHPGARAQRENALIVTPESYDASARTVQGVFAAGSPVRRYGFVETLNMDPAAVDLSRVAAGQCKLLDSHNQTALAAILGVVEDARIEGGQLVGTIRFADTEAGRVAEGMVSRGEANGFSIGYSIQRWVNVSQEDTGLEEWRADEWTLLEVTLCAVPADPGARVRSEAIGDELRAAPANRRAPPAMTPAQTIDLLDRAEFFGQRALAERMLRENATEAEIIAAARAARATPPDPTASIGGPRAAIGSPTEHARARGYAMHASQHNDNSVDNPDFRHRIVSDYFCWRSGGEPEEKATRELMGGARMMDAKAFLAGEQPRGWGLPKILDLGQRDHTTSDFPIAMGNGLNRAVRQRIAAQRTGYADIVKRGTLPNFKQWTEVATSGFPGMQLTREAGEIKFGTITEGGEKRQIATYTSGLSMTYQAQVNDEDGILQKAVQEESFSIVNAERTVTMAALSASLSDSVALFHANHFNLAGSGAAPGVSPLGAALAALMTAKGLDGGPLGLKGAVLMGGPAKATELLQLAAAIAPAKTADVNPYAGQLKVVIEPGITGNEWYVFADPNVYPTIKFDTLEGMDSPRFEIENPFNRLVTQFRVVWHIGAAPVDYRGAYKNPGA